MLEDIRERCQICLCILSLGLSLELDQEVFKVLEEFVCLLYGSRRKSVDVVRNQLFQRKHVR